MPIKCSAPQVYPHSPLDVLARDVVDALEQLLPLRLKLGEVRGGLRGSARQGAGRVNAEGEGEGGRGDSCHIPAVQYLCALSRRAPWGTAHTRYPLPFSWLSTQGVPRQPEAVQGRPVQGKEKMNKTTRAMQALQAYSSGEGRPSSTAPLL